MLLFQRFHVVLDCLRIGGHNGTVIMIIRMLLFLHFIEDTGIENGLDPFMNQIHDMTMNQFSGIADRFGRNGLHPLFKGFLGGTRRDLHAKAQFCKECKPEGIVFVHIQSSWQANHAPLRLFFRERLIIREKTTILIVVHIRDFLYGLLIASGAAFTAIARYKTTAAEIIDGQQAVIRTLTATGQFRFIVKLLEFFRRNQRTGRMPIPLALRDERRAEGSHNTGDIRTNDLMACNFLKGPQYSVVIEGAALHDDLVSHFGVIPDLDDLLQGILDDRIRQTCRNIADTGPLFLCLLDTRIHEYSTAGTQVNRIRSHQCFGRKILDLHIQRLREIFQEGTATGRTGLIQQNILNHLILNPNTFHVLTANIQDKGDARQEMFGRFIVSHGFNLAHVCVVGSLNQFFSISGDTSLCDIGIRRKHFIDFGQNLLYLVQRTSFVRAVKCIQDFLVHSHDHSLSRCGPCVNP